jgi:hypothetical protein
MDFAVTHWYPGANISDLLTAPRMRNPVSHVAFAITALATARGAEC